MQQQWKMYCAIKMGNSFTEDVVAVKGTQRLERKLINIHKSSPPVPSGSVQLRNWGNKKGLIRQHCLPSQAPDRRRFWFTMRDKRGRALQPTFQPPIPQLCLGNTAGTKTPFCWSFFGWLVWFICEWKRPHWADAYHCARISVFEMWWLLKKAVKTLPPLLKNLPLAPPELTNHQLQLKILNHFLPDLVISSPVFFAHWAGQGAPWHSHRHIFCLPSVPISPAPSIAKRPQGEKRWKQGGKAAVGERKNKFLI